MSRKTMAGMMVKYASMPAMFSASGAAAKAGAVLAATGGACGGGSAATATGAAAFAWPTAFPQVGQNATLSAICEPQFGQKAMQSSLSGIEKHRPESSPWRGNSSRCRFLAADNTRELQQRQSKSSH